MSVHLMALVFGADLGSPTRKVVALKLADYANDQGESIYPSIATIAAQTNACRSTVEKTLAAFRREGLLKVTRQGGPRAGPTRYRMNQRWLNVRSQNGAGSVPRT